VGITFRDKGEREGEGGPVVQQLQEKLVNDPAHEKSKHYITLYYIIKYFVFRMNAVNKMLITG
jgi:hypothetical protein